MDSAAILDVAIGLVLVYVLLSLLVSLITEFIARLFALRAKMLKAWLAQLFDDDTNAFYGHSLIRGLEQNTKDNGKFPSYISSKTFAMTLLDLALPSDNGVPSNLATAIEGINSSELPASAKEIIIANLRTVDGNLERARQEIADWFDGAMERVSGWYKRRMQGWTLGLGLVVALAVNADTYHISQALWRDDSLREAVVIRATQLATRDELCQLEQQATTANVYLGNAGAENQCAGLTWDEIRADLEELSLPLFWGKANFPTQKPTQKLQPNTVGGLMEELERKTEEGAHLKPYQGEGRNPWDWLRWFLGILTTATALSFGARFWFDLLTKLVNLRLTGDPPKNLTDTP